MNNDFNIISSEVLDLIMEKVPNKITGKEFVDITIDILTLCTSEIIRSGYCPKHHNDALEVVINKIKNNLYIGVPINVS